MRRRTSSDRLHGSGSGRGDDAFVFTMAGGIQLNTDVVHPYNAFGRPAVKLGPVRRSFLSRLDTWAGHLADLSDCNVAAISVCSVYRPHTGSGEVSRHAEGLAADVGGVWWAPDDGTTAWDYAADRRRAVAVESTMRLFFGTVLGPTSNRRHRDHWHVDCGKVPGITWRELRHSADGRRRIEVVYLQEACRVVHGVPLALDGIWGPRTAAAVGRVLDATRAPRDIRNPEAFVAFATATALVGFGQVELAIA